MTHLTATARRTAARFFAVGLLTTGLAGETARATGAESAITTNLSAEATRAKGAEATLTTGLAGETARATGAESGITNSLNTEVTRAQGAEAPGRATHRAFWHLREDGPVGDDRARRVHVLIDAHAAAPDRQQSTESMDEDLAPARRER